MRELNSSWIRSFRILCEERSFTRAAQRLNMTQPGMSQHIAKLEEQLGTRLVERDAPGFLLTEAGEKTLALAQSRWRQERAFLASLDDGDEDRGRLSLTCSGSFAMLLYPRLMDWMADAPDLSIHLDAAPEEKAIEGVLSGTFDFGVVSDAQRHPRLSFEKLGGEHLDLVLPGEWADRTPDFADLQRLGYIQHPDGPRYADLVLGANFGREYRGSESLRITSWVNQIGQIPAPVARGLGYTILPRSGILAFPDRDSLSTARLGRPTKLELSLVTLKGKARSKRASKLARILREEAGRLT